MTKEEIQIRHEHNADGCFFKETIKYEGSWESFKKEKKGEMLDPVEDKYSPYVNKENDSLLEIIFPGCYGYEPEIHTFSVQ